MHNPGLYYGGRLQIIGVRDQPLEVSLLGGGIGGNRTLVEP